MELKKFFYYEKDEAGHPYVTKCLVSDGKEHGRGVAVCSASDQLIKAEGRRLAFGRAMTAFFRKKTADECKPYLKVGKNLIFADNQYGLFRKYEHNPELNELEQKLLQ